MDTEQNRHEDVQLSKFNIQKTNVGSLNYAFIKEGKGHLIFFLHGFPDHAGAWDPFLDSLAKTNTCIAPFLRGYYPTDIPNDHDYSIKKIAKDIHSLALKLNFNHYSIVGNDWGASIAYVMANLYPSHIKHVVSLNMPHPRFLKPSLKLLYKARHILYLASPSKSPSRLSKNNYAYLSTLYKRWSYKLDYHQLKSEMVYCLEKLGRKEAALGYYWEIGKKQKTKKNAEIVQQLPLVPTLVLVGLKDGTADFSQFKKMESKDCFTINYHSNAGHFLHREAQDFCIQQLKNFILI